MRLWLAALLCLPFARPAPACTPPPGAGAGEVPRQGTVKAVIDGDTFVLAGAKATQVRLVGMQAPKLALGRKGFADWPLALESKRALEALVLKRTVRLYPGETAIDRNGRVLAQVHLSGDKMAGGDLWVQGAMIEQGLARVYTFKDNRFCAAALYARERPARAAGRGIWALPYYAIRDANAIPARDIDTFQLVEGTVKSVAARGGHVYLNFGDDFRTDFTASVDKADLKLFRDAKLDLEALRGRRVRIRGWLESYNGPMIDFNHPEQLEALGE